MPRYSLDPQLYPEVFFQVLRQDPPREAIFRFDSEKEAKNFQFRFWGLRKALEAQVRQGQILDYSTLLHRAERTECSKQGLEVRLTPKEVLNHTAEVRMVWGRTVEPGAGTDRVQTLAREAELQFLSGRQGQDPAQEPPAQESIPNAFPTKTLQQVLLEESQKGD